jgi:hypothetical protein
MDCITLFNNRKRHIMEDDFNQTLEYLLELAETLTKENERLRQQNRQLIEKILLLEETYSEQNITIEGELSKAHKKSIKNNQISWIVPKIAKA